MRQGFEVEDLTCLRDVAYGAVGIEDVYCVGFLRIGVAGGDVFAPTIGGLFLGDT